MTAGKYYSINVPLNEGTTDDTFHSLFKPIMRKVMEVFQPQAIVMQCGECVVCLDGKHTCTASRRQ